MNLEELRRRLTDHLAMEEAEDFHSQKSRDAAIIEGYHHISEKWGLSTGDLVAGRPKPTDFFSYGESAGKYNKVPPPLVNQSDEPWGGEYPQMHKLISYYAAFCLYRDKGPEMYERSEYWRNLFNEEATAIVDRTLGRKLAAFMQEELDPSTFGGMLQALAYNLDTSGMTPEVSSRLFPEKIRADAIRRVYVEITAENELCIKTARLEAVSGVESEAERGLRNYVWNLPADFLAPMNQIALSRSGGSVVGGEYPFARASTYAPAFSITSDDGPRVIVGSNLSPSIEGITIRYLASPPPLVNQTDKPWNGEYPTGEKLIILRAMRDMLRGKKELYQLSRFWQNEYDREVVEFKKLLKRRTLGQANRVVWGHSGVGIGDEIININWPDHLKNYIEWM